ncbi:MAG: L-seryl-tRNA(Sec) selenium transferase [Actinomycetota bacterium]
MDRRSLPSVDQFVVSLGDWPLPRSTVVEVARRIIDEARTSGRASDLAAEARDRLGLIMQSRFHSILNATGVLLHTNLGRAPLVEEAARAAHRAVVGYGNLELDVRSGERGRRAGFLLSLLSDLTGAESALVVNNNAGGLLLTLAELAAHREVVVSRGELIEIGGAYRLPDIVAIGGAELREVGTTNRTRIGDYRAVVNERTAVLLKVHTSNYRIVGFTQEASLAELVALGSERQLITVFDAGSGLLDESVPWLDGSPPAWLSREPGIRQAVTAGTDLVLFSGDKLFGGPQAGVVVGRGDLIMRLAAHPLARALRVDGSTVAALSVTAETYADGRGGELPIWHMATLSYRDLERRAGRVLAAAGVVGVVEESVSVLGAGSVPGAGIPSPVIVIEEAVDRTFQALLNGDPPVLARREAGRVVLDLRAVPSADDAALVSALASACRS